MLVFPIIVSNGGQKLFMTEQFAVQPIETWAPLADNFQREITFVTGQQKLPQPSLANSAVDSTIVCEIQKFRNYVAV